MGGPGITRERLIEETGTKVVQRTFLANAINGKSSEGIFMSFRVLVVEDEPFIAHDISVQLADAGFKVVGPAMSVASALELLAGCDGAVLDFKLGDEISEPIARKLKASGTPFVVLSGYPTDRLQRLFDGATILTKPFSAANLLAAVRRCVDGIPKATDRE
jgi:DNA-binding response OmpR family regulator